MNFTLFKREIKKSLPLLLVLGSVLAMYIIIVTAMYDPEMSQALELIAQTMPQLMSAFGMQSTGEGLQGFLNSYLYGMILLVFPMLYSLLRANGLLAGYLEKGSLVQLLAAPVKKSTIARTQLLVLLAGQLLLLGFCTIVQYGAVQHLFPGELLLSGLLRVNGGLLVLQFFMGGLCFCLSALAVSSRQYMGLAAGICTGMYLIRMLSNLGGDLKKLQYMTFFTLFQPNGLQTGKGGATIGIIVLLAGAFLFFGIGILGFRKREFMV